MSTVTGSVSEMPRKTAWSNQSFRRLWVASTVSSFGSEVAELALPLLALITLSATATEVSVLRVSQFLPFLLATLPIGALVDRRPRHRLKLMIGADVGRFLLIGSIPIAVWAGFAEVELVYSVVFAAGILTVLYQLADFAFLPSVVDSDQLVDANGRISASQSANEIGGRGLGGLLIEAISAPFAVAVNAAAFLGSALSLRRIRVTQPAAEVRVEEVRAEAAPDAAADTAPGRDIIEGLQVAVRNRSIRALMGEAATFNLFNEVFILGLLLYAVGDLRMGAAVIGLIFTAGGVGSFLGAWFGSRVTGRFGYGRVLLVALILGNSAPIGVALIRGPGRAALPLLCVIFVVMGIGIGIANVHAVSLRQVAVPEQLRGRVNAAYRLISWGAIPLGAGLGGIVASQAGAQAAMVAGAVGISTATLWVAFSAVPRLRSIADAGGTTTS